MYPTDLRVYFEQDGKWAIAALAARGMVAIFANHFVMTKSFTINSLDVFMLVQIVFAVLFLISKKRIFQITYTLLYGLVLLLTIFKIILIIKKRKTNQVRP